MQIGDLGHSRVENLARELMSTGRLVGSFLFAGPAGVGKEAMAVELGRILNCQEVGGCAPRGLFRSPPTEDSHVEDMCSSCKRFTHLTHPDLHLIFPVPTNYWEKQAERVGEIYQLKAKNPYYKPVASHPDFDRPVGIAADTLRNDVLPAVQRKPVEARFKVIILSDADLMAFGIGNLLLKTLEEPPADCLLVVTSAVPERLLPTIRSRCQQIHFTPLTPDWMIPRLQQLHQVKTAEARVAALLSQGSMATAERAFTGVFEEVRDRAFHILRAAGRSDTLDLLEMANDIARSYSKNRHLYPLLLRLVSTVARDALLVSEEIPTNAAAATTGNRRTPASKVATGNGRLTLINEDRQREIQECASGFGSQGLHAVIRRSEEAEKQIAGYAHAELTLSTMFLSLARESHKARKLSR